MTGWREAAEIPGLTFGSASPGQNESQRSPIVAVSTTTRNATAELTPLDPAAPDELLYRTALKLRPRALLLAITICLAAGGLWALTAAGVASLPPYYAMLALIGVAQSFTRPTDTSFVPFLIAREITNKMGEQTEAERAQQIHDAARQ